MSRRTIHKYQPRVALDGGQNIGCRIPTTRHSQLLDVQFQGDLLTFWFLVDPDGSTAERRFSVYGTGWDIPFESGGISHAATLQEPGTGLVWHVFEVFPAEVDYR